MNRVFASKLRQPTYSTTTKATSTCRRIQPGMPPPTLSRRAPSRPTVAAGNSKPRGLFAGLFDGKSNAAAGRGAAESGRVHGRKHQRECAGPSGFFGSLFKPKNETARQPPAPQGAVLAGLRPAMEPRKTETPKAEPQTAEAGKTQGKSAA